MVCFLYKESIVTDKLDLDAPVYINELQSLEYDGEKIKINKIIELKPKEITGLIIRREK